MARVIWVVVWIGGGIWVALSGPKWAQSWLMAVCAAIWVLILGGYIAFSILERRRLARKKYLPPFDRGAGNRHLKAGIDLLWKQDWGELSRLYRKQPPSDRYQFVEALGDTAVVDTPLPQGQSDSGALTICGGLKVAHAWRFRGGGTGASVSQADAIRMIDCLNEAQQALASALSINEQDSTALAFVIRSQMGLNGDREILNGVVARARASFEANIFVAANHLQFVTPKWHGSVEEMWAVANQWADAGPNAAWLAIAARAHIEEWLFKMNFDTSQRSGMIAKMQDQNYLAHLRQLDDLFWERLKAAPIAGAEASFAHNNFAFLLHTMQVTDRVARHLEIIGPYITALPWGYLPTGAAEPMHQLELLRKQYGLPSLGVPKPAARPN